MNVNQILNMVARIFMRKMISRGIDAGMRKATRARQSPAPEAPQGRTKEEIRAARRARRAAKQGNKP